MSQVSPLLVSCKLLGGVYINLYLLAPSSIQWPDIRASAGHPGPGKTPLPLKTIINHLKWPDIRASAGHPGAASFVLCFPLAGYPGLAPDVRPVAVYLGRGCGVWGQFPFSLRPSPHLSSQPPPPGHHSGAAPAISTDLWPRSPAHGHFSSRSTILSNPFLGLL